MTRNARGGKGKRENSLVRIQATCANQLPRGKLTSSSTISGMALSLVEGVYGTRKYESCIC